jgi:hypothetical protein
MKEYIRNMIATLVATRESHWGAYVASQESLEKQEQPLYLAPYGRPSEVVKAIDAQLPNEKFERFVDYCTFWVVIAGSGIEKPVEMPHRQR